VKAERDIADIILIALSISIVLLVGTFAFVAIYGVAFQ
jgi:hypothetical protein